MDSFIYSLNATVPIFFLMIIGGILKRRGMLNDNFVATADKYVFHVALPCMLFLDMADTDIIHNFDGRYIGYCFFVTLISILVIWAAARKFIEKGTMVGEFVQASYRSSAAILGIAFIQNIYGDAGMAPMMMIGAVPLYNVFAVVVLLVENMDRQENEGQGEILKALKGVVTNPILIGIALGMGFSLMQVEIPGIVYKTIDNLGVTASPLALISIGAGFRGREALAKIKPTIAATLLKLVVLEAIFLPVAVWFGFRDQKLIALIIMLGSPTTSSAYIMAKNMGGEGVLTSSIIVMTTLFSAVTLTFWIFLVRYLGLIL